MAAHGQRLWLIAGTGEGPLLARIFLQRGWRVRVSVVTAPAGHAYPLHPKLEIQVGALEGATALKGALEEAERAGRAFRWLIDASHPFASRITSAAVEATRNRPERVLRLQRPPLLAPSAFPLQTMDDLSCHLEGGERLLLAIGARQLRVAAQQGARAILHARVLPQPQALQQALAAGLDPSRIACVRPTGEGLVEEALCRLWQIDTLLCRQSGGLTERVWLGIAQRLGLRLLLLQRPCEPVELAQLPFAELVEHVGWPEPTDPHGTP